MRRHRLLRLAVGVLVCAGCQRGGNDNPSVATRIAPDQPAPIAARTATDAPPARDPADLPQPVQLTEDDWPQFRGERRDGISLTTGLLRHWPPEGPPRLWETTIGQGYSAPSVVADRVYLNDYDQEENAWLVRCFALDTGEEQWRYSVKKRIRPNHAITRSAPATDGGFVFAIDPKCELYCLDARNGQLLWKKFLPTEYDTQIPPWYNGQCPLIDEDRLVIATGGRVLMTALEKATGKSLWETENPQEHLLSHSSIMPVEIDGVRQYTYLTLKGLVGVDAETGRWLWTFPWQFNTAVPTTPLPLGDGKFFLTSGYHAVSVVCQVQHQGDDWVAEEVTALPPPTEGWNSEVHTPLVYREHIYGVGKKQRGLWTCLDFNGNELWNSEGQASFELGGYVLADGMFFVLEGKTGVLRVLDANADHYEELARVKLLEGPDVWAPPVIAHGKLFVRDLGRLMCLDIAADNTSLAVGVGSRPGGPR